VRTPIGLHKLNPPRGINGRKYKEDFVFSVFFSKPDKKENFFCYFLSQKNTLRELSVNVCENRLFCTLGLA
jgi:hypothetical protein